MNREENTKNKGDSKKRPIIKCDSCKYKILSYEPRYTKGRGETKKYWHMDCLKYLMRQKHGK